MYKKIGYLIVLFIATIAIQSCEEQINPEKTLQDKLKWTVDFKDLAANSLINFVPAIDESGNIYAQGNANYGTHLIKISPSGEKLWEKNNYSFSSRIIYNDNRLFFIDDKTIKCVNAADGSLIWEKEDAASGSIIALSADKIYTIFSIENDFGLFDSFLYAFDLDGNKYWQTQIKHVPDIPSTTMCYPYVMSVKGNQIYLGVLAEVGDSNFAILEYTDNGSNATKTWTWQAPDNHSFDGTGKSFIGDLAIDDNGDILFTMFHQNTQYLLSVNSAGTLNWKAPSAINARVQNVITDGLGGAYICYDAIEKFNAGNKIWTSDLKEDWDYKGVQSMGLAISDNKNISSVNQNMILTHVNKDGTVIWEQYNTLIEGANDEYHNVTINRNGDIIITAKSGIRCYEGDGSGLSTTGWSKIYGNYGNTGSR